MSEDKWQFPLNHWRETNIPCWQKILKESIIKGDGNREKFARFMLKDVLEVEIKEDSNEG
jgi:hypothetical protein